MRLHRDWIGILKKAWSVRLMALAALMGGIATWLSLAQPYLGVNPLLVAAGAAVSATAASLIGIYARIVQQAGVD